MQPIMPSDPLDPSDRDSEHSNEVGVPFVSGRTRKRDKSKERRHFALSFSRLFSPEEAHQRVNPAPFSRYAHSCDKASKASRSISSDALALVVFVSLSLFLSLCIYRERGG